MLAVLPKQAKEGVCYVNFSSPPGTKSFHGFWHPCLGLTQHPLIFVCKCMLQLIYQQASSCRIHHSNFLMLFNPALA